MILNLKNTLTEFMGISKPLNFAATIVSVLWSFSEHLLYRTDLPIIINDFVVERFLCFKIKIKQSLLVFLISLILN